MSKRTKIIIFIVFIIALAAMIFYNMNKNKDKAIDVTLGEVKKGDITKVVSGSGKVQPETDVKLAARISAEIRRIHVKEGDHVRKGQLLVELDREKYAAQLEQVESQVASAKAGLKKAEADYVRINDLFTKHLTSQAELDAAEATRESSQSQLDQSLAYLKQSRDDLEKTNLLSPIDGTVTKLNKEEGEIAVGSQFSADVIMNIADLSLMEVLVEIDENEVVLASIGDSAKIEVDAIQDTTFKGLVTEIAHTATTRNSGTQEQVTNFEVKVHVVTNVEKLRPGMSATVDIATETHKGVLFVPIQCVTAREIKADSVKTGSEQMRRKEKEEAKKSEEKKIPQKEVVFVVENNIAKQTQVKTGISDDSNIEILSGLTEGQKIVSGSYKALSKQLKDGAAVKEKKGLEFKEGDKDKKAD
jgi:HlyD family secretion protein